MFSQEYATHWKYAQFRATFYRVARGKWIVFLRCTCQNSYLFSVHLHNMELILILNTWTISYVIESKKMCIYTKKEKALRIAYLIGKVGDHLNNK